MKIFAILILSIIAYTQAFPQAQKPKFDFSPPKQDSTNRRFEITHLNGAGSPGQGFDLSGGGKVRLWESNNGKNQLHGTGSYSQHLGGPGGNSKPNFGGGVVYTRTFG